MISTPNFFKVAAIQMVSTTKLLENLQTAEHFIREAAQKGAQLVLLPEYFCLMGKYDSDKIQIAESPGNGFIQSFLAQLAAELKIYLIAGTIPLQSTDPKRILNSCLAFNPEGKLLARYDKIHLFSFTGKHESYCESDTIQAGKTPVVAPFPFGRAAFAVCYDIRFPELFRSLGEYTLIVLPAAFVYDTGQAHWEILLRARAIENQCYLLAAAQGGTHENGRKTWGHSMLIDPWGKIISQKDQGEGLILGEIGLEKIRHIRQILPALNHRIPSFS